jgi:predicted lipoprotein with Yx(FWY)xxD motif
MRHARTLVALASLAAMLALTATSASAAPYGAGAMVNVGHTGLGRVLVDAKGHTLYVWAHDKGHTSTCNGQCAKFWPPVITHGSPKAAAGVRGGLLGTSKRADGRRQVTYNGHPLYTFIMDKKAGQTNGEGLTGFGGRWDPVSSAGAPVRANASSYDGHGRRHVRLDVITPGSGDTAGAGGVFNIDLAARALDDAGNDALSAANGYVPFLNLPGSKTFGPGLPDPGAPGLVVTMSTTPDAAGGPNANLAGVFQLNAVNLHHNRIQVFNDWQVGKPGFFGQNVQSTMTAYLVQGTAPGVIPAGGLPAISNVVHRTFTIAG